LSSARKVLGRKRCRAAWRQQLARYAWLDVNAKTVSLNNWLDTAEASSELVDFVNPA